MSGSRAKLISDQIARINSAAKSIAEKAAVVFADNSRALDTIDLLSTLTLTCDNETNTLGEDDIKLAAKGIRDSVQQQDLSEAQKDFLDYFIAVFESLAISKLRYKKFIDDDDNQNLQKTFDTLQQAREKIGLLSKEALELNKTAEKIDGAATALEESKAEAESELSYRERPVDGHPEIDNNIASRFKLLVEKLSAFDSENTTFNTITLENKKPGNDASNDEITAYNDKVKAVLNKLLELENEYKALFNLEQIKSDREGKQKLSTEYNNNFETLRDLTTEYNRNANTLQQGKEKIAAQLAAASAAVKLREQQLANAAKGLSIVDDAYITKDKTTYVVSKAEQVCEALKAEPKFRYLSKEAKRKNAAIAQLQQAIVEQVGTKGLLAYEHAQLQAQLIDTMNTSIDDLTKQMNSLNDGQQKQLPVKESFDLLDDDIQAVAGHRDDAGNITTLGLVVTIDNKIQEQHTKLQKLLIVQPKEEPLVASVTEHPASPAIPPVIIQRKKSFRERHPILTGIGIGLGIGLAIAGVAALCLFIPPVGAFVAGLGAVGLVTGVIGVPGAIAAGIGTGAVIGAAGGLAGGIATAIAGKKADNKPQSRARLNADGDSQPLLRDSEKANAQVVRGNAHERSGQDNYNDIPDMERDVPGANARNYNPRLLASPIITDSAELPKETDEALLWFANLDSEVDIKKNHLDFIAQFERYKLAGGRRDLAIENILQKIINAFRLSQSPRP